jgi:hypothetical protein
MPQRFGILQGEDRIRSLVVLCFVLAFFSFVSAAKADTVNLNFIGAAGSTTLNVSDPDAGYANVNALIDPYTATITTMNGASSTALIWCVDPDHEVNPGDSWTANVYTPGGNLGTTYLGNAKTYGEMAWLVTQLHATSNPTTEQEIQAAIWELAEGGTGDFTVNSPTGTAFNTAVGSYESAASSPSNVLTSGFEILSDTAGPNGAGAKQEFLVLTPEPPTVLLLAFGLFALLMVSRSKALVLKAQPAA